MTGTARQLGRDGVVAAADWYLDHGYRVVARAWRCREGELDLIVADGRLFVFCEVQHGGEDQPAPVDGTAVRANQERIRHLAARWLEDDAPGPARAIRFDVASVREGAVVVVEGAF